MAAFTIIAVSTGQRLEAGVRIVETLEAICVTAEHEINYSVTVDKTEGWKERLAAAAQSEADELESVFAL